MFSACAYLADAFFMEFISILTKTCCFHQRLSCIFLSYIEYVLENKNQGKMDKMRKISFASKLFHFGREVRNMGIKIW